MILLELFITFFKTGLLSFGGGYAMISMLSDEAVKHNWMSQKEFFDIVAVSQITPGPIAINMATFVGFRKYGLIGAIVSTLGVSLPSFLLVITFLNFITKFNKSFFVRNLFYTLKPAVIGLIGAALIQIAQVSYFQNGFDFRLVLISLAAFIALYKFKFNVIAAILIFSVVGIIIL